VRVESRTEKHTGDAGFLLLHKALDRAALIDPLAVQLEDPRDPRRSTHSLPPLLRASLAAGGCATVGLLPTEGRL